MVRYLLNRPIGTFVVAFILAALGLIVTRFIPISLLPDIPIPEITVQASYPNADARQIQQVISIPLRNQLLQLNHLDDLEAVSQDGQVIVKLRFGYGTDIGLAYIEANEKIDRLMESFPRDMPRPKVIKAGAGDISVFSLNVSYKREGGEFLELSNFCENVLKRRLEQLSEIAFVDITGLAKSQVLIQPDVSSLQRHGITVQDLGKLIQSHSGELGNIVIKEGPYEYSISLEASLKSTRDIENLYLRIGSQRPRLIRLGDVAKISIEEQKQTGSYSFNGSRAIAMAIVKQNDAQMLQLRGTMKDLVKAFKQDYPNLNFQISQDQTELLDLSINNLVSSLLLGAALSFVMIGFFMGDKRVVFFIGLVIPISLAVTLLGFYVLGISINIVSLAGLVLGIGEIVDSAIIIIENIEQHLHGSETGDSISLEQACVNGSEEVIRPLFTSVLTNSAVFLPLLFLSGIAGALFFDQAVAVSLALGISLLTSYTFIPVLYFQFFKNRKQVKVKQTRASQAAEHLYNAVFNFAMRKAKLMILLWVLLVAASIWVSKYIDKQIMPRISRTELEIYINWNEPVSPVENMARTRKLMNALKNKPLETGLFIGEQQFLLNTRLQQSTTEALVVAKVSTSSEFDSLKAEINRKMRQHFPRAVYEARPALNVFEQLFQTTEPPLRVLVSGRKAQIPPDITLVDSVTNVLSARGIILETLPRRERIRLRFSYEKLLLYGIEPEQLLTELRVKLNDDHIGVLRSDQQQIPILLGDRSTPAGIRDLLDKALIINDKGGAVPIKELVSYHKDWDYASLFLGKDGPYVPLEPSVTSQPVTTQKQLIDSVLSTFSSLTTRFAGSYYRSQVYLLELSVIIIIAIGLLFFILAAQFESLQQPVIVLLTIVFGATGALISLHLTGSSLNIMSGIGLIVLIGLLDNDSILKMDTMNRARDKHSIIDTIRLGGLKRLQSQLMTFLTTVLGLLPILWSSGLGAELQRPLAIAVIGGMLLGVLISWSFIPIMYYWLYAKKTDQITAAR